MLSGGSNVIPSHWLLSTVNFRNNNIRYNSKIRYSVNLVCTKVSGSFFFFFFFLLLFFFLFFFFGGGGGGDFLFIDTLMLFFKKTYFFVYLLELPRRDDSNKYTKRMFYIYIKKRRSKVSVIHALDVSISSFFITANSS